MPEFLERRYAPGLRTYYASLLLALYVLTKISVALYAGGVVLQQTVGWDIWSGAGTLVVATGLYVSLGGMTAVVYTEVLQSVVLIAGGLALLWRVLQETGGLENLLASVPPSNAHLFQPADHKQYPWTGVFLGLPFTSVWYWCTDQSIVQRTLSAKSLTHARRGAIAAGFLKLLPPLMMVLPGMGSKLLFPEAFKTEGVGSSADAAFPIAVMRLMPSPLLGLQVAAMLAALMSSLASVFNSASTVFTMDVWRRLCPRASEKELVFVGRMVVLVGTVLGLLWIPLLQGMKSGLYVYTHKMMGYLAPPITVVFLGGLLWPRANAPGASACLLYGGVVGVTRLIGEILIPPPVFPATSAMDFFHFNFLHFTFFLGSTSFVVLVAVSLLTKPPPYHCIHGLTYQHRHRPTAGAIQMASLS
eukprot:CAMPEP_0180309272 /NCGR_PEP_ID=MMETSP0988-20121125/29003_1 /TAXON_ID=697907 /ORGANISM="non described non described, Strain CCMP2293" /LENGTH=415 /DNA_ID=CAMNT_0022293025 /DNA_START=9 /DNA_END=1252 /DNA_ORIENTATION=-